MAVRRPQDLSHHEAQLDGIRIQGSGPPLVLMHGWPGFWWEWYKCIGALAEAIDVIAPYMRGYGDIEKLNELSKYHLNVEDGIRPQPRTARRRRTGHDVARTDQHRGSP